MSTEFNELLQLSPDEKSQIWIIGTREQVTHIMNEMTVIGFVRDRVYFSPIIPAPFANGKFMAVVTR